MDDLVKELREAATGLPEFCGWDELYTRAADRIEALSGKREEIARIIDPEVWAYFDAGAGQHNTMDLLRFDAWKQSSLRKADGILALISPTTESPK